MTLKRMSEHSLLGIRFFSAFNNNADIGGGNGHCPINTDRYSNLHGSVDLPHVIQQLGLRLRSVEISS